MIEVENLNGIILLENYITVYADGSKCQENAGCTFVVLNMQKYEAKFMVHKFCSNNQAELFSYVKGYYDG